jgi:hypothetical protein
VGEGVSEPPPDSLARVTTCAGWGRRGVFVFGGVIGVVGGRAGERAGGKAEGGEEGAGVQGKRDRDRDR